LRPACCAVTGGVEVNVYRIPVIGKALRLQRVNQLVEDLSELEAEMRDVCAALVELTDPNDDLHVEVVQLIKALDG
jgi:uncharacterized coiled-coil DUF342 family protein